MDDVQDYNGSIVARLPGTCPPGTAGGPSAVRDNDVVLCGAHACPASIRFLGPGPQPFELAGSAAARVPGGPDSGGGPHSASSISFTNPRALQEDRLRQRGDQQHGHQQARRARQGRDDELRQAPRGGCGLNPGASSARWSSVSDVDRPLGMSTTAAARDDAVGAHGLDVPVQHPQTALRTAEQLHDTNERAFGRQQRLDALGSARRRARPAIGCAAGRYAPRKRRGAGRSRWRDRIRVSTPMERLLRLGRSDPQQHVIDDQHLWNGRSGGDRRRTEARPGG